MSQYELQIYKNSLGIGAWDVKVEVFYLAYARMLQDENRFSFDLNLTVKGFNAREYIED